MKLDIALHTTTASALPKINTRAKPETVLVKAGINKRVPVAKANLKDLKIRLKAAEGEVVQLKQEIATLENIKKQTSAVNAKPALKGMHTFLLTESMKSGRTAYVPKQRTVKTLKAAVAAKGGAMGVKGYTTIYAVTDSGSKTPIMKFASVDPITGATFRGYSWRFVSARAKARFGHLLD